MNVLEKQSWFLLIVMAVTLGLYLAVLVVVGYHPAAFAIFGLSGLAGAAPLIGRRERKAGKIVLDERDRDIERSGTIAGFSLFWVVFVAAAMAPFVVLGPHATITIQTTTLPSFLIIAACLLWSVRSLVIVVLYRRNTNA